MATSEYRITGRIIERSSGRGMPGLRVQAWDKDSVFDDLVGTATTDRRGAFRMAFTVAEFRDWFLDREPDLFFKIFRGGIEIGSTEDEILWNFRNADEELVIRLSVRDEEAVEPPGRRVNGRVVTEAGLAAAGLRVTAYAKRFGVAREPIGSALTSEAGSYEIDYTDRTADGEERRLDVFVECLRDATGEVLATSGLVVDAEPRVSIDIVVADSVRPKPTKLQALDARLTELVGDSDLDEPNEEDLRYLEAKLDSDSRTIATLVRARLFGQRLRDADVPDAVPAHLLHVLADEGADLEAVLSRSRAALGNALRRAANGGRLPAADSADLDSTIDALKNVAVDLAMRPADDAQRYSIRGLVDLLLDLSDAQRNAVIRAVTLNEKPMDRFWRELPSDEQYGDIRGQVDDIREMFDLAEATSKHLPLVKALREQGARVARLAARGRKGWIAALDAAGIGPPARLDGTPYGKEEYADLLERNFRSLYPTAGLLGALARNPALTASDKPSEAVSEFAAENREYVIGAVSVRRYLRDSGTLRRFEDELAAIEDPTEREREQQRQQAFLDELHHLELAYVLAPDTARDDGAAVLKAMDLGREGRRALSDEEQETPPRTKADSAVRIATTHKAAFKSRWVALREKQGAVDRKRLHAEAEEVVSKATRLASIHATHMLNASSALDVAKPAMTSSSSLTYATGLAHGGLYDANVADLRTLFGTADYCECAHCQSIYGPAAYLDEIIGDLPDQGDTLYRRRPDIETLRRDCANTNTQLPYIDLVIELLEQMVVSPLVHHWKVGRQTTLSEDELALRPEHEDPLAYAYLSVAAHARSLPWDKWFAEARLYLGYTGVPLHRIIEVYAPVEDIGTSEVFDYWAHRRKQIESGQVVRAHLGLALPLYDLITKPIAGTADPTSYVHSGDSLDAFFRIPDDVTYAKPLKIFMQRLGLWRPGREGEDVEERHKEEFKLVRSILGSRYVQDAAASNGRIRIALDADSCDFTLASIPDLTKEALLRIVKFENLRRAVGWDSAELSWAIAQLSRVEWQQRANKLGRDAVDENLLVAISAIERLRELGPAGTSVNELMSWWGNPRRGWGPINTGAAVDDAGPYYADEAPEAVAPAFYDQVFLDRSNFPASGETGDSAAWRHFELNASRTELEYLGSAARVEAADYAAPIAAALELPERELGELIGLVETVAPFDADLPLKLGLGELAALYRFASLARYLKLDVADLTEAYLLVKDANDPFRSPVDAVLFVETIKQLERSGLDIRDLSYIWRHRTRSAKELEHVHARLESFLGEQLATLAETSREASAVEDWDLTVLDNAERILERFLLALGYDDTPERAEAMDWTLMALAQGAAFVSDVAELDSRFPWLAPLLRQQLYQTFVAAPRTAAHYVAVIDQFAVPAQYALPKILADIGHTQGAIAWLDAQLGAGNPAPARNELQSRFAALSSSEIDEALRLWASGAGPGVLYAFFIVVLAPKRRIAAELIRAFSDWAGLEPRRARQLVFIGMGDSPATTCVGDAVFRWFDGAVSDADLRGHLLRFDKIAYLAAELGLNEKEIAHIKGHPASFQGFDFLRVPIEARSGSGQPTIHQWKTLASLAEQRRTKAQADDDWVRAFEDSRQAFEDYSQGHHGNAEGRTRTVADRVAALLKLEQRELLSILETLGYLADARRPMFDRRPLDGPDALAPILELAEALGRLGQPTRRVGAWVADPDDASLTLDASLIDLVQSNVPAGGGSDLLAYKVTVANEIRNAVRGNATAENWREIAKQHQDRMRVLQRDHLLDAIYHRTYTDQTKAEYRFADPNALYEFLLIDPLMQPCMQTSRLKQATGAVQLLSERILMGLEGDKLREEAREDGLAQVWTWKRRYRFWEAQMKVMLYPENWLEPELRDDKTPFFEEFESEIAQSRIDQKSIEKAFKSYLRKVEDVANLEVAALRQQFDSWSTELQVGGEVVIMTATWAGDLHFIGRTTETPATYYYRRRNNNGIWQPWQRVGLDIESDVVLLTVYKGRPYLFWPSVKERIQKLGQDNPEDKNNEKNNYRPYLEITFNWSRLEDGIWTPKKKTSARSVLMYDWGYPDSPEQAISYEVSADDDGITIDLSIIGTQQYLDRYVWNEDKLSQLFLAVKRVPEEIDWGYLMPGWDMFAPGGLNQSHVDLIREHVEKIAEFAEKQLKLNLYALPQNSEPLDFITKSIVTGYQGYDFNNTGVVANWERWWHGLLGIYLSTIPTSFGNEDHRLGMKGADVKKVNAVLEPLYEIDKQSIDLQNNRYRYLRIDKDVDSDNDFLTFSRVRFDGHRLKPSTVNTLGLWQIVYPNNAHRSQGLASILETRNIDDVNPVVNAAALSAVSFDNDHVEIEDSSDSHVLRVRGLQNSLLEVRSYLPLTDVVLEENSSSANVLLHHVKGGYFFGRSDAPSSDLYRCEPFFHADAGRFSAILDDLSAGTPSDRFRTLLDIEDSQDNEKQLTIGRVDNFEFAADSRRLSFLLTRPYGGYNWEIFFHIPFTVAMRLSQDRKFEEAQEWFHYIFDPLRPVSLENESYDDDPQDYDPAHFWHFLPLHRLGRAPDVTAEDLESNAEELTKDPFNPHRVARLRHGAYQYAVVMRYLDNLIAWGDFLFAQDTIESINEATQKYVLAARILGERPKIVPKGHALAVAPGPQARGVSAHHAAVLVDYEQLWTQSRQQRATDIGLVQKLSESGQAGHTATTSVKQGASMFPPIELLERSRCIPPNDKLLSYWDTVADRLFKIRHCRNIQGQVRELPLFEPPIDPALLVRGKALGVDLADLLSDLYAPLPAYRFKVMIRRALELSGDVQRLGGNLLQAIEKRDAEELSLLRARHERAILKATRVQRQRQIKEAETNLKSTMQALETAEARREYYASRPFENPSEKAEVAKRNMAQGFNLASQIVALGASAAYAFPNFHQNVVTGSVDVETGGKFVGDALSGMSNFLRLISDALSHEASMHSIQGLRERRMDDWQFQARQAKGEISQIEKQVLAGEIRVAMAEHELELHSTQEQQAEEVESFLETKFSNRDLYGWMVSRTSEFYFQSYKLAVDLARMAEKCFQLECCDEAARYVDANYWDNFKQGLTAGDQLQYDLRRMDADFDRVIADDRERHLTKNVSLNLLAPAQLDRLRYEGACRFHIPELLFDLDFPHHYRRRIKSIRASIPCIVGPYASVPCELHLVSSMTRMKDTADGGFVADANRPGQSTTIALSTGRSDPGLHQDTTSAERYLPFELRGVDSIWEARFPSKFRPFDLASITDLILHIDYTARQGDGTGKAFEDRQKAIADAYTNAVAAVDDGGMGQRIDIRRSYPDLWYAFQQTGSLSLTMTKSIFPYLAAPIIDGVNGIAVVAELQQDAGADIDLQSVQLLDADKLELADGTFLYRSGATQLTIRLGQDLELRVDPNRIDPTLFSELIVVLSYNVTIPP